MRIHYTELSMAKAIPTYPFYFIVCGTLALLAKAGSKTAERIGCKIDNLYVPWLAK